MTSQLHRNEARLCFFRSCDSLQRNTINLAPTSLNALHIKLRYSLPYSFMLIMFLYVESQNWYTFSEKFSKERIEHDKNRSLIEKIMAFS